MGSSERTTGLEAMGETMTTTRLSILRALELRLKRDAAQPCTCKNDGDLCNSCEAKEELEDIETKLGAVREI